MKLTYVGLFETRASFDGHPGKQPSGRVEESGFGAGGAAPGQLFVESVRDIVIEFEQSTPKKPQEIRRKSGTTTPYSVHQSAPFLQF